ncbi:MAG: glycosyltransferase [Spirochaetaceae bacterium]
MHWGYACDRDTYRRLLSACDIVVSTAVQENFGIAVVEAVGAECIPVLPKRLSYPEIIPARYHASVFYQEDDDLVPHLERVLSDLPSVRHACRGLAEAMSRYRWQAIAGELDAELDSLQPLTRS